EEVCYSAATGRSHWHCRLSIVAATVAELRDRLEAFLAGQRAEGIFSGTISEPQAAAVPPMYGQPSAVEAGQHHVQGAEIDWRVYYQGYTGRGVQLPTYPFQRERYWIDSAARASAQHLAEHSVEQVRTPGMHPLLGRRVPLAGGRQIYFESQVSPRTPA